jgi:hypothetical protein
MGCHLISLITDSAVVLPKPKHTMLPILTVLFLISYGLMAFLVVEQGRTIESQRNLLHQLLSDSTELSSMKGKAIQEQYAQSQARAHAQTQAQSHPQAQTPSTQAAPQASNKTKVRKPFPQRPSTDGTEMADERRSLKSI